MSTFLDDDFLLESEVASDLYHRVAAPLPIIDYHCHLSPQLMADDHRFRSITEIWLDGDHYKWRAMRSNGVPERYCTGDASDWEKFEAWARTVPHTVRNPLYHWTHMELRRPFGVDDLLSPATATSVFDRCNARLRRTASRRWACCAASAWRSSARPTIRSTRSTPTARLAARPDPDTRVYPTWRPDKAFAVEDPAAFNA